MKNFLLFFLSAFSCFAQNSTVQLELVNFGVGSVYNTVPWSSCGAESNDAGLNAIFYSHNVYGYCSATFLSYSSLTEVGGGLIHCTDCDAQQLISDLEAYGEVVGRARLTPDPELYANYLYIKLPNPVTQTVATPENVIVTSNIELSQVFEDFTVYSLEHQIGSWYLAICDCFAPELAAELVDQAIILPNDTNPNTGDMIYNNYSYQSLVYLSISENAVDKVAIYPNPYNESLTIQTNLSDVVYSLFDITGKKLVSTTSADNAIETATSLRAGVYFLKMLHNGQSKITKIVKQ